MPNIYYGWIPILGTRLYFHYAIEELEIHEGKLTEKGVKDRGIEYDINHKYYRIYTSEDVKNKKFEFIVAVDKDNRVDKIYYSKGKKLKALAHCEIDNKGLVKLEVEYYNKEKEVLDGSKKADEYEIAYDFYRIVRNIYHRHTHHEDSKDSSLKIVPTKDRLHGIEQILSHFEQKTIIAHKRLRDTMKFPKRYGYAAKLITQSRGEMIYALNFVNLFKKDISEDKEKEYKFVFSNALQSLNVLADKIEKEYDYKLNHTIAILTYGILLLTTPITIDAILNVFEPKVGIIISLIIFLILLLVVLLVVRHKVV